MLKHGVARTPNKFQWTFQNDLFHDRACLLARLCTLESWVISPITLSATILPLNFCIAFTFKSSNTKISFSLVICREVLCAKSSLCLEIFPCNLLMRCFVFCQRFEPLVRRASWRCNWFNFSIACFKNFGLSATKPFEPTTVCFELMSKPVIVSKLV